MKENVRSQVLALMPDAFIGTPKYNLILDYIRKTTWLPGLMLDSGTAHTREQLKNDGYKTVLDECTHMIIFNNIWTPGPWMRMVADYALKTGVRVFIITHEKYEIVEVQNSDELLITY